MKNPGGFTLIEVLIYLALFAVIIGGAFSAAYGIVESSGRNQTKAMLQEEGDFLIAKINWALSGARAVSSPAVGGGGSALSVAKWDTSIGDPVVVSLAGGNLNISRGGNAAQRLNNSNLEVSCPHPCFTHISASGAGTNPESLETSFSISSRTPNGAAVRQDFFTTTYLRK